MTRYPNPTPYFTGRLEAAWSDGSVAVLELTMPDDGPEENANALLSAAKAAGLIGDNDVLVTIRPAPKPNDSEREAR